MLGVWDRGPPCEGLPFPDGLSSESESLLCESSLIKSVLNLANICFENIVRDICGT